VSVYSWGLFYQLGAAVIFLPLVFKNISLVPAFTNTSAYITLTIACLIWAVLSMSNLISYKHTDLSLREPVSQSKILWTLILGVLILGESITTHVLLGTFLVFVGIVIAIFHPERKFGDFHNIGIRITLASAFVSGCAAIIDKASLHYFNPNFYAFITYLVPGLILLCFARKRLPEIKHLLKTKLWIALMGTVFSSLGYYFTLKVYSALNITIAYPILQLGVIFTIIAGIWFLKEKENMTLRILGTVITLAGVILLKF
jgi:drug/metabolite transporter (DMT)-like permease